MALVAYDDSDSDEEHETDMKDGVAKKLNDGNVNTNNKQNENIFIENKLKLPPVKAHEDRENGKKAVLILYIFVTCCVF